MISAPTTIRFLMIWMQSDNFADPWTPLTLRQALPEAYVAGLDE